MNLILLVVFVQKKVTFCSNALIIMILSSWFCISHVAPLNRVYAILGWFWEISFLFNWYWYKVTIKIINFDAYVCIKKERITAATALYCNTIIKCSSITYHLTFHSTATMTMTTSMVTRCNNSTLILWLYCF